MFETTLEFLTDTSGTSVIQQFLPSALLEVGDIMVFLLSKEAETDFRVLEVIRSRTEELKETCKHHGNVWIIQLSILDKRERNP